MKKCYILFILLINLLLCPKVKAHIEVSTKYTEILIGETQEITIYSKNDQTLDITVSWSHDNITPSDAISVDLLNFTLEPNSSKTVRVTGLKEGCSYLYFEWAYDDLNESIHHTGTADVIVQSKQKKEKPVEPIYQKSSNNYLKSLTVLNFNFEFDKDKTDYELKVPNNVEKIEIGAETESELAKYVINNNDLVVGENLITIDVTAENGENRTYTIKVIREKEKKDNEIQTQHQNLKSKKDNNSLYIIIWSIGGIVLTSLICFLILKRKTLFKKKTKKNIKEKIKVPKVKNKKKIISLVVIISTVILIVLCMLIVLLMFKHSETNKQKEEMTCPESYKLKDKKCIKEEYVKDADIKYFCDKGYELNENKCEKTTTNKPTTVYNCEEGKLNGTKCIIEKQLSSEKNITCSWPAQQVGNKCIKNIEYPLSYNYICPDPYQKNGSQCIYSFTIRAQSVNGRYMCTDSSCSLVGNSCSCRRTIPATEEPYCSKGTYSNGKCIDVSEVAPTKTYYSCSQGELLGDKCIIKESKTAKKVLGCLDGYNLNNGVCEKLEQIEAQKKYSCEKNQVLKEEKCYKKIETKPSVVKN